MMLKALLAAALLFALITVLKADPKPIEIPEGKGKLQKFAVEKLEKFDDQFAGELFRFVAPKRPGESLGFFFIFSDGVIGWSLNEVGGSRRNYFKRYRVYDRLPSMQALEPKSKEFRLQRVPLEELEPGHTYHVRVFAETQMALSALVGIASAPITDETSEQVLPLFP